MEQNLNAQFAEIDELCNSRDAILENAAQIKSKISQLEANRIEIVKQNRETRETICKIGENVQTLQSELKDCQLLCDKFNNNLASYSDQQLEQLLADLQKLCDEKLANKEQEYLAMKNQYKLEIEAKEKLLREAKEEAIRLDSLEDEKKILQNIFEGNAEDDNLTSEITEKRTILKNYKLKIIEEEKYITEQLEKEERENRELLEK